MHAERNLGFIELKGGGFIYFIARRRMSTEFSLATLPM